VAVAALVGEVSERLADVTGEVPAGVNALRVAVAVDFHGEPVAAGVDVAGECGVVASGCLTEPGGFGQRGNGGAGEAALLIAMRASEAFELGEFGVGCRLVR
jgi:hypothetical protein